MTSSTHKTDKQYIDSKITTIAQLFSWPDKQMPTLTINYVYDTQQRVNIAFTEFLIDIGLTPDGRPTLRAHTYKITLNCSELLSYPESVQDFIIAHEIAHVQQLHTESFLFITHKLMYTPFMMHVGFMLGSAVLLGFTYAQPLWYFWLCSIIISNALSRSYELDADKRAACTLGSSIGGQLFLQAYSREPQNILHQTLYTLFYLIFSTHPAPAQRIIYLRNLTCR